MNRLVTQRLLKIPLAKQNKQVTAAYSMLDKPPTIHVEPEPLKIEDKPFSQQKMSRAMKQHLDAVNEYKKFMNNEHNSFEIGKRHLANMMGADPDTFTQDDINDAIEYLFPCGLFQPTARPFMRPPDEIFPPKKEAAFDMQGRPYHFLFYTGRVNYYQHLHDMVDVLNELQKFEDDVIAGKEDGNKYSPIDMHSMKWIEKDELSLRLDESVPERDYENLLTLLKRIATNPYGSKAGEVVHKYLTYISKSVDPVILTTPKMLPDGRQMVRSEFCKKKHGLAHVNVIYPGTGKYSINGQDIHFFNNMQSREQDYSDS